AVSRGRPAAPTAEWSRITASTSTCGRSTTARTGGSSRTRRRATETRTKPGAPRLPAYARGLIFVDEPDRVPQLGLPKLLLKKGHLRVHPLVAVGRTDVETPAARILH